MAGPDVQVVQDREGLEPFDGGTLVPTMGALHEGHLALVRRAASIGSPVVVSVFVNPTQFGPGEDFDRYPRDLEADVMLAAEAGADVIFAPAVETMYPPRGEPAAPRIPAVAVEPGLEDACRPGHFAGVCQVVARLFDLVRPRIAVFGEKDYQQLLVIEAMVAQEQPRWEGLRVERHPTVRDADGLAMSSRNAYLRPEERERALGLVCALRAARDANEPHAAERLMRSILVERELEVEYAVIRNAETLLPAERAGEPLRALVAVRLGLVRLIDNGEQPKAAGR